jgi:NADH-quinone oxidoreductase subunit I
MLLLRFFKLLFWYVKLFLLFDMLKGLKTTMNNFFSRKITIQYPEVKTPQSQYFRGLHALRRYSNGDERCIGCKLCEIACPANAISIKTIMCNQGIRKTTKYEIDLFKCVFCGFCESACPVDAIIETCIFEYHIENRGENILTKDKLLSIGDEYEVSLSANTKLS